MNIKKNVLASVIIGLTMNGVTSEGIASMKEEEMTTLSLQNYTYQSMDKIAAFGFTDEDFHQMKKVVSNFDFYDNDQLHLEQLIQLMDYETYNPKRTKCSEKTFNHIVMFNKVLKRNLDSINPHTTQFAKMLLNHLMHRYL